ncbi:MAG: hypothetical protein HXX09_09620 [Bacteroidetes bacterium]|nr:hypothetical protein [Bacteroidota bacterium]
MNKFPLILLFSFIILCAKVFSQTHYISKTISSRDYNPTTKKYGNWSELKDFDATISIDYGIKTIKIYDAVTSKYLLNGKYLLEVNPDNIKGDWQNEFTIDPKTNTAKINRLRIFQSQSIIGGFEYTLDTQNGSQMLIGDVEPDEDQNGIGDISQNETPNVVISDNSTMGTKHVYFTNKTTGNVYVSLKSMERWLANEEWTVTDWMKILPGERKFVGENVEEYLYYYAYSKLADGSFIEWKGDASYNKVGTTEGSYGFRKVVIDKNYINSKDEWTMDISN